MLNPIVKSTAGENVNVDKEVELEIQQEVDDQQEDEDSELPETGLPECNSANVTGFPTTISSRKTFGFYSSIRQLRLRILTLGFPTSISSINIRFWLHFI